jgi:hypothetical protein
MVYGLWFRVWGLGSMVLDLGFRVRVMGQGWRVKGLCLRV